MKNQNKEILKYSREIVTKSGEITANQKKIGNKIWLAVYPSLEAALRCCQQLSRFSTKTLGITIKTCSFAK